MRLPTRLALVAALALGPAAAVADPAPPTRALPESRGQVQLSFAPLVRRAAPSVVNVYGAHVERRSANRNAMDEFLRRFFGETGPGGTGIL